MFILSDQVKIKLMFEHEAVTEHMKAASQRLNLL